MFWLTLIAFVCLLPSLALAYVDPVGSGLIYQIGYIILVGIVSFFAFPVKAIKNLFKKKNGHNPKQ